MLFFFSTKKRVQKNIHQSVHSDFDKVGRKKNLFIYQCSKIFLMMLVLGEEKNSTQNKEHLKGNLITSVSNNLTEKCDQSRVILLNKTPLYEYLIWVTGYDSLSSKSCAIALRKNVSCSRPFTLGPVAPMGSGGGDCQSPRSYFQFQNISQNPKSEKELREVQL